MGVRFTLVLVSLCAIRLTAQQLTSASGTVTDPTGALIPNATVILESVDRGLRRDAISDAAGRYNFPQVQPGRYRLVARATGFAEVVVNDVSLAVNTPATVNIVFEKLGTVSETISVVAESTQVNTTDATIGNAIGNKAILQLPLFARNIAGLLGLQPGVTNFSENTADSRTGAVNGGKSDQANVTVDGIDANSQQYRYSFTSVLRMTLDSTQEFRTTTFNAGADQGRSSGAQIALVTRGGTNDLHGALYEYHRNTKTAANRFFLNSSGVPRGALLINVFGARVDGPIKKNKAFFMLNYEGRRDASAANILRTVPTAELRNGVLQYQRTDGSIGTLSPEDVQTRVDPAGIGGNRAALDLLKTYPLPNDFSVGDGLNIAGYRFTYGQRSKEDTYIARLDYGINPNHQLFVRGNLQNDHYSGVPQFPGEPPRQVDLENTKGVAVGWNAVLRPSLISTTRYGITRQSFENTGLQNQSAVSFRNLDDRYALTTGFALAAPVHNITQDFAWTHGAHDVRFGGVLRWNQVRRRSYAAAFHDATSNAAWLRGTGSDLYRLVTDLNQRFRVAFTDAASIVLGIIPQGRARYNYGIDGSVQPVGSPVRRRFKNEEYEMYLQDTWRVSRGLTLTAGLRYSLMPPVYEADGVQISSNISLGDWFNRRGALAAQGKSQQEAGRVKYVLANSAEGMPLYDFHKKNLAPRLALAWSPQSSGGWISKLTGGPGRTSIRAGWGMHYDLFGFGLIRLFDASAFGLATSRTNPGGQLTSITAPRFTGVFNLPQQIILPAPKGGFPAEPPDDFTITNSIDDRLRPPYSINQSLSVGREFRGGLFIQGSYVGRLSRRSLIQRDLAMPTDLRDPASNTTYFQAAQELTRYVRARTPTAQIPRIAYWENLWGNLAGGGLTATQAVYNEFRANGPDTTTALADLDHYDDPGCGRLGCNAIFNPQYSALAAWSSVAGGNYHGMQWTVRKRFGDGLMLDFNYTWAKSIDLASAVERGASFSGFMLNPWSPGQRKGVSDYDVTQIWNAAAVWELPYGKGRRFGAGAGGFVNTLFGGWQIAPIWTQSTELPIGVSNGRNYPTNWQIPGFATQVGAVPTPTKTKNAPAVAGRGGPNIFADPSKGLAAYDFTFPGETGQRNGLRGDGAFRIDLSVAKRFVMPYSERHSVQFRWETFNVTNTVRFDVASLTLDLGNTGNFGKYSGTLGRPREMQFALRYEF